MSEIESKSATGGPGPDGLRQAVAFLDQALAIADAAGLTVSAARIDHALATLREEISRLR
jgi:hypothetical protein